MRRRNVEPIMAAVPVERASNSPVNTAVYGQYAAASAGRASSSSWVKYFPRNVQHWYFGQGRQSRMRNHSATSRRDTR